MQLFENAIYLFSVQPFDPADTIVFDDTRYAVNRITLLSVELIRGDGAVITVTTELCEGDFMAGIPDMVKLSVSDNGIGFNNKYKEQIFTIFQRLHGRNEYEGTGIGLATCRKIVERHGGDIDADGVEGEGATFTAMLQMKHNNNDKSLEEECSHGA